MPTPLHGDPYRILGLPRGAPLADVKRAYRRLAKQHHPDSAGPAAARRFIAIQAAYEAIVRAAGTGGPQRGGGQAATAGGTRTADPPRDARGTADDPARRDRRGPSPGSARRGEAGADGAAGTAGRSGSASAASGRRKATPGSTTYDDAGEREPEWDGSAWYGPASGTYWTVNPREYADPRKHGPEYQERARRALAEERTSAAAGAGTPGDHPGSRADGDGGAPGGAAGPGPRDPAAGGVPDDVRSRIADAVARAIRRRREPRVR